MSSPAENRETANRRRGDLVLAGLIVVFALVAVALIAQERQRPARQPVPRLVDRSFLDPSPTRQSHNDLVKAGEDVSQFSCYVCHERTPVQLKFDERNRIILPDEHSDILMAHGSHERNNHCFNCHSETNLETLHIRDGRDLRFGESSQLCGSCHGPTYADWEAGAHGRISGHWDRRRGPFHRLDCVNCHDPHAPKIPSRIPAPPPRPLRATHP